MSVITYPSTSEEKIRWVGGKGCSGPLEVLKKRQTSEESGNGCIDQGANGAHH
jgi:hypothetical protein